MINELTRRQMLLSAMPALAAAGTLAGCAQLMAQPEPAQDREPRPVAAPADARVVRMFQQAHADGEYKLPPLPYAYDALEPHIDAQTMELHHSRHHQAYVDGLNRALRTVQELQEQEEIDGRRLEGLQRDITFNGGGHMLHTLFWAAMAPDTGGEPQGPIAQAIDRNFGSFDAFKNYYSRVATGVKGSGWAIMAYEPAGDNLVVFQFGDQDLRMIPGSIPLLPIDVWEHAYYLKYQNRRAEYVEAWWNVVNWLAVNEAYVAARRSFGRS